MTLTAARQQPPQHEGVLLLLATPRTRSRVRFIREVAHRFSMRSNFRRHKSWSKAFCHAGQKISRMVLT